jgi:hypothetical protein
MLSSCLILYTRQLAISSSVVILEQVHKSSCLAVWPEVSFLLPHTNPWEFPVVPNSILTCLSISLICSHSWKICNSTSATLFYQHFEDINYFWLLTYCWEIISLPAIRGYLLPVLGSLLFSSFTTVSLILFMQLALIGLPGHKNCYISTILGVFSHHPYLLNVSSYLLSLFSPSETLVRQTLKCL